MSPTETKKAVVTSGEKRFLSVLRLFTMFYLIFAYQTVWNWFIADYLFTVTYWEMFFGGVIMRFIINPLPVYSKIKSREKEYESLSFSKRLEDLLFKIFFATASFAVFFIIRLIISYYS